MNYEEALKAAQQRKENGQPLDTNIRFVLNQAVNRGGTTGTEASKILREANPG